MSIRTSCDWTGSALPASSSEKNLTVLVSLMKNSPV